MTKSKTDYRQITKIKTRFLLSNDLNLARLLGSLLHFLSIFFILAITNKSLLIKNRVIFSKLDVIKAHQCI